MWVDERRSLYKSKLRSKRLRSNIIYSLFLLGVGAIIGGFAGVFIFIYITGGSATPSEPISAPALSLETLATPTADEEPQPTAVSAALVEETSAEAAQETLPTPAAVVLEEEAAELVEPTPTEAATATPAAPPPQLFRIVAQESQARFSVYETFPEGTAVGVTNEIAGDIIVDYNTPANSQLGTIRVNLRTLQTDDPERDRSIRCCVLLTAQPAYEFADFVPTALHDLPAQVELGQTLNFRVTGDLTLRGTTQPVTFSVVLTLTSAEELRGSATTAVNRTDFGILNDAENGFDYHGVEEQVTLTFDFVARAVSE